MTATPPPDQPARRLVSIQPRTLFLQLEDYAFFHSPSQIGDVDDRFIGRERIIAKLRTLLTNSDSKSGAYLITGYRGMGKSSYVGKVLHEINSYRSSRKTASRYFRILVPLLLLSLLDITKAPILLIVLPLIFFLGVTGILVCTSPALDDLHSATGPGWRARFSNMRARLKGRWVAVFLEILQIDNPVSARRPRTLAQDFLLISAIHLVSNICIILRQSSGAELPVNARLTVYLFSFGSLALLNALAFHSVRRRSADHRRPWWSFKQKLGNYVAHADQVHIRINLGYDDLSELDILRLIARNILSTYRHKMRPFSLPQLPWTLGNGALLYLFVGLFYYSVPLHQAHRDLALEVRAATGVLVNSTFLAPLIAPSQQIAGTLDRLVQDTYDQAKHLAPKLPFQLQAWTQSILVAPLDGPLVPSLVSDNLEEPMSSGFRLLPKDVDYLFWIYFLIAWSGVRWASAKRSFVVVTHSQVIRRLVELNDLIDAQVTQEPGVPPEGATGLAGLAAVLIRRSRRTYQRLSEREIEKMLIEILDDVARIPRITLRPEFILIFDEIDKIEPHQNSSVSVQEEEESLGSGNHGVSDDIRSRQRNVQRLLSNLKYLLTTAKAKFIFIAGRELFDASLADVSDRNFFMGSVFNGVINVESFMKDRTVAAPGGPSSDSQAVTDEVTTMTEHFVVSSLLPGPERAKGCHAAAYRGYLERTYGRTADRQDGLERSEVDTIMGALGNFITYLTYRSNGAPKKLSSLFERYVTEASVETLQHPDVLRAGRNSRHLYLRFDANDRYTFSVGAYIITPFFLSLDKTIQEFGDKLLVSSAFLIDHLYKFHRSAFSWRSIELTPEILDINRAPHLRQLIVTIVRFLQQGHLKEVDNGLHNLKFRRKISEEINVLSKLNEHEAAAFNFTLDESLATKQHYTRQLRQLEQRYKPHFGASPSPEWVRSISFLHMIVGDLHFYDDEYDNAIVEYMEAVQMFGRERVKDLPFESFIVLVRNTLKLGLSFERRRTYDSALMTYGKLVSRIIRFRQVRRGDVGEGLIDRYSSDSVWEWIEDEPLTVKRAYLSFRQDVMRTLRLLYQPCIAKFQIKEKLFKDGVTEHDLRTVEREWKAIVGRAPRLVEVDFLNRTADVLFYKNRSWIPVDNRPFTPDSPPVRKVYCHSEQARCGQNDELDRVLEAGRDTPCSACSRYNRALDLLMDGPLSLREFTPGDRTWRVVQLMDALDREATGPGRQRTATVMRALAANLSNAADTFLSCAGPLHGPSEAFLKLMKDLLSAAPDADNPASRTEAVTNYVREAGTLNVVQTTIPDERLVTNTCGLNKTEEVLIYLYLSAAFFRRSGEHRSAGWQYTKLLYVLRDWLRSVHVNAPLPFEKTLIDVVAATARGARRNYDAASDNAYWLRETRRKAAEGGRPSPGVGNWDSREVDVVVEEFSSILAGPLALEPPVARARVTSMYNRILDLRLQAIQSGSYVKRLRLEGSTDKLRMAEHLTHVIGCWAEIIRITGYFGVSFNINHSLIATAHYRLASALEDWTSLTEPDAGTPAAVMELSRLESLIKQAVDSGPPFAAAVDYHRALAVRHYRQALDTHDGGVAYRQIIEDMVYLNDDFNDDLYHFCAAQERYWLNRRPKGRLGKPAVYERLDELKKKLGSSPLAPGES